MTLYFSNSNGDRREIGKPTTFNEGWRMITAFCDDKHFIIHYTRMWKQGNETWYDVGSHSEFFIITEG